MFIEFATVLPCQTIFDSWVFRYQKIAVFDLLFLYHFRVFLSISIYTLWSILVVSEVLGKSRNPRRRIQDGPRFEIVT